LPGEFTPDFANDLHADVLDAARVKELLASLVGALTHTLAHFGRDFLSRRDAVSDDLRVQIGSRMVVLVPHSPIIRKKHRQFKRVCTRVVATSPDLATILTEDLLFPEDTEDLRSGEGARSVYCSAPGWTCPLSSELTEGFQ
jgi:hypothetical protein